jgi:hypothetical protein
MSSFSWIPVDIALPVGECTEKTIGITLGCSKLHCRLSLLEFLAPSIVLVAHNSGSAVAYGVDGTLGGSEYPICK